MNLLLVPQQFQIKNIKMGEVKQNKMMNGIFTKIEYKEELMVFNGVYIVFNIENPVCESKEKVYTPLNITPFSMSNVQIRHPVSKMENENWCNNINNMKCHPCSQYPNNEHVQRRTKNVLLNRRSAPDQPYIENMNNVQTYNEIQFNLTSMNNQTVNQLSQIETNIIHQYNKYIKSNPSQFYVSLPIQKKYISIKHNLYNQKFKLYNSFDKLKSNTFMLKISGIWEDDYHIGLTYKISQVESLLGFG
jgi:hypothetical protein